MQSRLRGVGRRKRSWIGRERFGSLSPNQQRDGSLAISFWCDDTVKKTVNLEYSSSTLLSLMSNHTILGRLIRLPQWLLFHRIVPLRPMGQQCHQSTVYYSKSGLFAYTCHLHIIMYMST
ncbi:hypothetical protein OUZ56_025104 [Daphnia magna]|uniref:Uncharacterized protein n=1 Tax=Daphnia magna TaxID=35525 RepID=A0ABQ9ZJV9_9CRUS|nr:hypothetical protein OUZ56_025104 [Daphnia magna]